MEEAVKIGEKWEGNAGTSSTRVKQDAPWFTIVYGNVRRIDIINVHEYPRKQLELRMSFPLPHLEVSGTPVTPPKDQDTPDTHIYKSFAKRRMSLDMGSPIQEICRSLHMFEQFLIIGVPPKSETPKPQILAMYPSTQYPQSDKDLDNLISFCFPGKLEKATTTTILAEEFVFYMHNEKKERSYGVCVHVLPPVDSPPFFADRTNRDWPFCLCLLTRQPFFCAHFQFLSYLAMALCGKVQCSLKRTERTPVSVK